MKLISYEFVTIVRFGDAAACGIYFLTLEKSMFFGLFKKKIGRKVTLPYYTDTEVQLKYWDNLIKTQDQFI